MATINYDYAPLFMYHTTSYRDITDIPTTANADEVYVLIECERTPSEIIECIEDTPITKEGLVVPKFFKKRMRLTDKRLVSFEIVNELLELLNKGCTVVPICNEWSELDLTATFQSSDYLITIVGVNSEPHLYVNVIETVSGDTYISNGRLCKEGHTSGECIVMCKDYTELQFKVVCDQWIMDFLNKN